MLEKAGLIEIVEKREVRGALEKFYRAVADRFVAGEIVARASSESGVGLVQNFVDLLRYSAESTDGEGVALHVLGIQCAPERIPEFQQRLQELVQEFQGMSGDEGRHFGLIAGVFPIPEDALAGLPEHPDRILGVEGKEMGE